MMASLPGLMGNVNADGSSLMKARRGGEDDGGDEGCLCVGRGCGGGVAQ